MAKWTGIAVTFAHRSRSNCWGQGSEYVISHPNIATLEPISQPDDSATRGKSAAKNQNTKRMAKFTQGLCLRPRPDVGSPAHRARFHKTRARSRFFGREAFWCRQHSHFDLWLRGLVAAGNLSEPKFCHIFF